MGEEGYGHQAIDGLKSQPAFFALVVMVVSILVMLHYAWDRNEQRRQHQFEEVLARCNFQQYGGPGT